MMISFLSYSSFSCCLLFKLSCSLVYSGLPFGSDGDDSACNARDLGSIPGSGRSPGEGRGNPLQYSCLGNPMDREAWWATVHGAAKSGTRLNNTGYHDKQPQTERLNKVWVVEI